MIIPFEHLPTGQELADKLTLMDKPIPFEPISSKDVPDEFNHTLDWIRKQRDPKEYRMGIITFENAWPEDLEFLKMTEWKEGQVITFRNLSYGSATIYIPYSKERLAGLDEFHKRVDYFVACGFKQRWFRPIG